MMQITLTESGSQRPRGGEYTCSRRARARHVHQRAHTMYTAMYVAARAVVHRLRSIAHESLEVAVRQGLTSRVGRLYAFCAGLPNPAHSPNPALTRRHNMRQHNELQSRAGLPG